MLACSGVDGTFANPASVHVAGTGSRSGSFGSARQQLADLLNARMPDRLIFTSGATESDNLAIRGAAEARAGRGKHLVTMPTEHKAVTDTFRALEREGFEVSWLQSVGEAVVLASRRPAQAQCGTTRSWYRSCTSITKPVSSRILPPSAQLCRSRDVLFHTDAAQSAGKLPIDLDALPVDLPVSHRAQILRAAGGRCALYRRSARMRRISADVRRRPGAATATGHAASVT